MPLTAGTRLGAYEIAGLIGSGGMGEVYRARDGRLDRIVAIKILPLRFAADPNVKQRFEREAKALASLSHPHICSVFDVGHATTEQGAIDYLVIEYLEGETLAQRLGRGPLAATDALQYAVEIADALDKAHRKGVIHRDLKPSNVMLTSGGVKLLDFGLAKMTHAPIGADVAAAPTVSSPLTGAGTILGTFQYMAPEQLEGQEADARSDIFAFGAVIYEMITGKKAFEGKSQASLIGAILEREPAPVSQLQPTSPAALDQIVKTCLAKNPDNRWQSAADIGRQLKFLLDSGLSSATSTPAAAVGAQGRKTWLSPTAIATALIALAAVGIATWALLRPAPAPSVPVSRLLLQPAANAPLVSVGGLDLAISPDGRRIVYLGEAGQAGRALYLRELSGPEPHMIPGTELPSDFISANPFFSWDGKSIGFSSPGNGILRVALDGGPPVKIADAPSIFIGAAWGPDDAVIVALGGLSGGLFRAAAGGGDRLESLLPVKEPQTFYVAPSMLPSGKAVLFYIVRQQPTPSETVAVFDLETGTQKALVEGGANPVYATSGHLVFARGTTLMAVPFDPVRLEVKGTPIAVLAGVRHPGLLTAADYTVSRTGTLIYVPGPQDSGGPVFATTTPVWVDRQGRQAEPVVATPLDRPLSPSLSPDGKRLIIRSGTGTGATGTGTGVLSAFDLDGRPPLPLVNTGSNLNPLWSPDGKRVFFSSNRDGVPELYVIPSDGSTLQPQKVKVTTKDPVRDAFAVLNYALIPVAWMPTGRLALVVVRNTGGAVNSDVVTVPVEGGEAEDLIRTEYSEDSVRISPNGRWLAYRSNRSGRSEIWVRAVTGSAPTLVSQNGGREPVWARDGTELFYLEGNKMMALAVKGGQDFSFSAPQLLFDEPYFHGPTQQVGPVDIVTSYDVAANGRFIMIPQTGDTRSDAAQGIVVFQNWTEELKRLVPTN
jgi:Tol biopolymer transport system component